MRRLAYIAILLLAGISAFAAKTKKPSEPKQRSEEEVATEQEHRYFFYEGVQKFDQAKYDEALALFLHCEALIPEDAATCHYLSVMYGGMRKNDLMIRYTDLAYKGAPLDYWKMYVNVHLKEGGNGKRLAKQALEYVGKQRPNEADAFEKLQSIYMDEGNAKQALKMQDELDRIDGPSPYGAFQRYSIYHHIGKEKQAVAAIDDYLEYDPNNYNLQVLRGQIYVEAGQMDEALAYYTKVEAFSPENPYLAMAISEYYAQLKDTTKAIDYQMKAIENTLSGIDYKLDIVEKIKWDNSDSLQEVGFKSIVRQYPQEEKAYMALGRYYVQHKQNQEASQAIRTVIDINPQNADSWQMLYILQTEDSTVSDDQREAFLKKAITALPDMQEWYGSMVYIQQKKNQPDSALHYCMAGLRTEKHKPDIDLMLLCSAGDIFHQLGRQDSAFSYYERALAIDPNYAPVLNNYAYYLATSGGDLRKAEKMSQICIKQDPNSVSYLDTYAWILHLQGQDMLARFYIKQAWSNLMKQTDEEDEDDHKEIIEHYTVIFGQEPQK